MNQNILNMQQLRNTELPDFIVKSTLGISITAFLLLIPFIIINLNNSRYLISFCIVLTLLICGINIWLGLRDRYHNKLNIFGVIILAITAGISIQHLGVMSSYWSSLVVLSPYFILPKRQASIANIIFVCAITPIAINVLEPTVALRFLAVLFGISFFAFTSTHEIYKQHYLLREQSVTDVLTGLYNRSLLQSSLENVIHQKDRSSAEMSILMIDIDHFKAINDQFGHDVGDSILKSTGEFLNKYFRGSDMIFRIGGEEFLALMFYTDQASAMKVAEKIRKEFIQLSLISDHIVTLSIGVSNLKSDMDWKQWMKHGDENLYKAKSNGRNQVFA